MVGVAVVVTNSADDHVEIFRVERPLLPLCLLRGPCHLFGCGLPSRLRGSVLSVSSLYGRWSQERLLREWASGTGAGRKLLVSVHKQATSVGSRGPVALGTSGDGVEHAPELPP